jgi:hypothetical protein
MNHSESTFLSGCAVAADTAYFAKEVDEYVANDQENSDFLALFDDDWFTYDFSAAWSAISMATIKPGGRDRVVVAVSPRGAFWEVRPGSGRETNGEIDAYEFPLRGLAAIAEVIYACGMGRTVLRRRGPGNWEEIGPGTSDADGDEVVGFEAVAGFSADEIYAVGWRGEIWLRTNRWRRLDSPVSANLNAVCCAPDGKVYVAGDDGTLLRGRNDVWEAIDIQASFNFMDVASYDNMIYVVTDFQILKLIGDVLIPEDGFADPDDRPATCLHLLPGTDALFSMGTKDLFRRNGGLWERLV